jgi:hypothetical protein
MMNRARYRWLGVWCVIGLAIDALVAGAQANSMSSTMPCPVSGTVTATNHGTVTVGGSTSAAGSSAAGVLGSTTTTVSFSGCADSTTTLNGTATFGFSFDSSGSNNSGSSGNANVTISGGPLRVRNAGQQPVSLFFASASGSTASSSGVTSASNDTLKGGTSSISWRGAVLVNGQPVSMTGIKSCALAACAKPAASGPAATGTRAAPAVTPAAVHAMVRSVAQAVAQRPAPLPAPAVVKSAAQPVAQSAAPTAMQTVLPSANKRFAFSTGMVWQVSYKPAGKLITTSDQWTVTEVPEADGQRANLVDTSGVTFSYELDKDGLGLTGEWQACHLPGKLSADHKSALLHPLADAQDCLDMFGSALNVSIGAGTKATPAAGAAGTTPASTGTATAPTVGCTVTVSGAVSGTAAPCLAIMSDMKGYPSGGTGYGEQALLSFVINAFPLTSSQTAELMVAVQVANGPAGPGSWSQATVAAAGIQLFKGNDVTQEWWLSTFTPAQGTMSLTLTGFDWGNSVSVDGATTLMAVPHGSLIADLPAVPGSGATGSVHLVITF